MDEAKELENYLQSVSDEELANTINLFFENEFNEIDPDFQLYYYSELDRLRLFDTLNKQILILKKEKGKIKKYLKDEQQYQTIMANLDTVEKMFNDWKNSYSKEDKKTAYIVDWNEEFADMKWCDLDKIFPEIKLSTNLIKKIVRTARDHSGASQVKDRYKITEPQKPERNNELKENHVDRAYSEKTNAELLEMLGRNTMEYLVYMIDDALVNRNTQKLRFAIRFTFAHFSDNSTKGKEYARTDKQSVKDPSKTSGKTIVKLLDEYNSMLSE